MLYFKLRNCSYEFFVILYLIVNAVIRHSVKPIILVGSFASKSVTALNHLLMFCSDI